MTEPLSNTDKMPVLFLGHGSPMNAIEENEFVTGSETWRKKFQSRMQYFVCLLTGKLVAHLLLQWKTHHHS